MVSNSDMVYSVVLHKFYSRKNIVAIGQHALEIAKLKMKRLRHQISNPMLLLFPSGSGDIKYVPIKTGAEKSTFTVLFPSTVASISLAMLSVCIPMFAGEKAFLA